MESTFLKSPNNDQYCTFRAAGKIILGQFYPVWIIVHNEKMSYKTVLQLFFWDGGGSQKGSNLGCWETASL